MDCFDRLLFYEIVDQTKIGKTNSDQKPEPVNQLSTK